MPEGPNGVPRLTSLGPFVKHDEEVQPDDLSIETHREDANLTSKWLEYGSLSKEPALGIGVTDDYGEYVKIKIKYQTKASNVLTSGSDSELLTYTAGRIEYGLSDVAYIHKVKVNQDLKRLGIGSELMNMALDDIESEDIDKVYSKGISEAGRELMESFGFSYHDELNKLNPQNEWMQKEV